LKLGFLQVWQHKTNPAVHLIIIERINDKYKVKINGPLKNMHLIEIVSSEYVSSHYKYAHKIKIEKKAKKSGRKKK
jgi:hypothetical protein